MVVKHIASVFLLFSLFNGIQSFEIVNDFTADLGNISVFTFSKFHDDAVVFAYRQFYNDMKKVDLTLKTYTLTGELKKTCAIDLNPQLVFDVKAVQLTAFDENDILISWVVGTKVDSGNKWRVRRRYDLNLYMMNLENCSSFNHTTNYTMEYIVLPEFPFHSIVRTGKASFDVIAAEALMCQQKLCKLSIPEIWKPFREQPKIDTFIEHGSDFFTIVPVDSDDHSKGLYYISQNYTTSDSMRITTLHPNGTAIKSVNSGLDSFHAIFSNAYGHISFCVPPVPAGTTTYYINCYQTDSSLEHPSTTDILYETSYWYKDVMRTKSGGFLFHNVTWEPCEGASCKNVFVKEIGTDGKVVQEIALFKEKLGPIVPDPVSQAFINDKKDLFCDAAELSREAGVRIDVKVQVKCVKIA